MSAVPRPGDLPEEFRGRYRMERLIGRDRGVARWLGHDLRLDRAVLIAILESGDAGGEMASGTFLDRMRLLGRISHPGVRAVHLAEPWEERAYAVLEYVDGVSLATELERGVVPRHAAARIGRELLEALEASHAQGVSHPDLDTASVWRRGTRLVLDGLAAARAGPEAQHLELDAVGRIVYRIAAGRPCPPAPGPEAWAAVARPLRPILARAVAADPTQRWPDAASFRQALAGRRWPRTRLARHGLAAAALGGAILAGTVGLGWTAHRGAAPTNEVAVVPLDAVGSAAGDSLGSAVAVLLGLALENVPGLRVTSPRRIARWTAAHAGASDVIEPDVVRQLGVRWVVHGLVTRWMDSVRVRLTLYPWQGTKTSLPELRGAADDLPGLTERLALATLEVVARELEPRVGMMKDFAGVPFVALTAFLQGEIAFDRDEWTVARSHYEVAARADPSFALAEWRLANVKRWERGSYDFFTDLPRLDRRLGGRLRPADRAVIEALREPDLDRRLARLDSVVSSSRPDAYLQYLQAEELFHRGPLAGHDIDLAVRAMARTIALDSSFAEAYTHIFGADLRAGRRAEARRMLELRRRIASVPSSGDLHTVRLMELAYDERFVPWRGAVRRWWLARNADRATLAEVARVARLGGPWFDIPAAQVALCRLLLDRAATNAERSGARNGLALGLMMLGRPAAALAELDSSLVAMPSAEVALQRAEWELIAPWLGLPVTRARDTARATARAAADSGASELGPRARWALALDRLAASDTSGAREEMDRLESATPGTSLATLLRAAMTGAREDWRTALAISDSVRPVMSVNHPPDPFAGAAYHLLRAEWHREIGDFKAAVREWRWIDGSDFDGWPTGVPQAGEVDAAFGVLARWRRGSTELATATTRADTAAACSRLRRVAELWHDSEPAFHPLRAMVSDRLEVCPS